jgi:chromatin modification-related protein YNG2
MNTRHFGLTKNKIVPNATGSSSTPYPLPLPPGEPIPIAHLSTKDQMAMTKIQTEWGKVVNLQQEKIKLAERLERITTRARERGRAEWIRVGGIDLDELEGEGKIGIGGLAELGSADLLLPPGGLGSGMDGRQKGELFTWLIAELILTPVRRPKGLPLPSPGYPIIHPPASHSMLPPPLPRHHPKSSRSTREESESDTMGDGDVAGSEDTKLYCICQERSYGEMIGCDNAECAFEWVSRKGGVNSADIISSFTSNALMFKRSRILGIVLIVVRIWEGMLVIQEVEGRRREGGSEVGHECAGQAVRMYRRLYWYAGEYYATSWSEAQTPVDYNMRS